MIDFSLFDQMERALRGTTEGPWFVSPEFEDENDSPCVTIGTHMGDHYEETIAQVLGSNGYPHVENATFMALMGSNAGAMLAEVAKMRKIIEAAIQAVKDQNLTDLAMTLDDLSNERGFKVIKPHTEDQRHLGGNKRVFLAGSIDNGKAEPWQSRVEEAIKDCAVTIYNPRCDDWNPDLVQDASVPEFAYQVNWELDNIEAADTLFFYFSPGGPAPITLMELGKATRQRSVVVCCPEGYWRRGNIQVLCQREQIPLYDNLDDAIEVLKGMLDKA